MTASFCRTTTFLCRAVFAAGISAAMMLGPAACGSQEPPLLSPLPQGAVILAFGDSLTAGIGAPPGRSYPEELARLTGLAVVEEGVPGEVTAQGPARLSRVLKRVRPDLVVICHGGNDLLRGLPRAATEANLAAMVDLTRRGGAQALLVGVPNPGPALSTADLYARVASEAGVPLEPDALADILSESSLKADPIHPNAQGYARLAHAVADLLVAAGGIPGGYRKQ